jgi:hypothetical protein
VAVVVSIARGHDASYPFKSIGAAEGPVITGERGAGYYLSAVEKGGEPAGTWVGSGAAGLGFRDGDVVRREDFEPLYGQFLDPRDPAGRTYLGSPPRVNAELAANYQAKLAAHPGATADERMRLLAEARAEYEGRSACSTSTPRSAWTRPSPWPTPARWPRRWLPGRPVTCGKLQSGRPGRPGSGPRSRNRSGCTSGTCRARPPTCGPVTTAGGSAGRRPGGSRTPARSRWRSSRSTPAAR